MTYADLLRQRRNALKLKQDDVAQMAGVTRTYYVGMEGGVIPTAEQWRRVIAALGITEEEYLAHMTPEQREKALDENRRGRRNPKRDPLPLDLVTNKPKPVKWLKVYVGEPCGDGSYKFTMTEHDDAPDALRDVPGAYFIEMPDDSMEPAVMKGDRVAVNPNEPAALGDLVVIQGAGQGWFIKRLLRVDGVRDELVVEDIKGRNVMRLKDVSATYDESGEELLEPGTQVHRIV